MTVIDFAEINKYAIMTVIARSEATKQRVYLGEATVFIAPKAISMKNLKHLVPVTPIL